MLSQFSLTFAGMTRGEAEEDLRLKASDPAEYEILQAEFLAAETAAVDVKVLSAGRSNSHQETWIFRLENGRWLYNFANLIEVRTLDVEPQTTGGITLVPRRMALFSDHFSLELLAQNRTGEAVVLGQSNEILATFDFAGRKVTNEAVRVILEPLRSYPHVVVEARGEFRSFPLSVEIRTWKDYQVDPWYRFDLAR
jgi:hypothetical protein